jgi:hypothetical protein
MPERAEYVGRGTTSFLSGLRLGAQMGHLLIWMMERACVDSDGEKDSRVMEPWMLAPESYMGREVDQRMSRIGSTEPI